MRNINAAIITAIESGTIKPFFLLELYIDAVYYRYTDCDVPIQAGGEFEFVDDDDFEFVDDADFVWENTARFEPRGFSVAPIEYSTRTVIDSVKIELDNLDDVFTAIFIGGTPQDSAATLKQILMSNEYTRVADPVILFQGEIDSWDLGETKVNFTITSEFVKWSQRTLAKHSPSCRWKKFKGTECAYAGAGAWCDRTFARCSALANTDNFGGFRWLPSIVDKEIWWGANRAI